MFFEGARFRDHGREARFGGKADDGGRSSGCSDLEFANKYCDFYIGIGPEVAAEDAGDDGQYLFAAADHVGSPRSGGGRRRKKAMAPGVGRIGEISLGSR